MRLGKLKRIAKPSLNPNFYFMIAMLADIVAIGGVFASAQLHPSFDWKGWYLSELGRLQEHTQLLFSASIITGNILLLLFINYFIDTIHIRHKNFFKTIFFVAAILGMGIGLIPVNWNNFLHTLVSFLYIIFQATAIILLTIFTFKNDKKFAFISFFLIILCIPIGFLCLSIFGRKAITTYYCLVIICLWYSFVSLYFLISEKYKLEKSHD
jgi:hypothetical membrane protein